MDTYVVDKPAQKCAEILCEAAEAGAHIVLTGGATPREAYERAAAMGADWSAAKLWWGDERCVPPDDPSSNYRLAKEALLDRLDGDPPHVHRMPGEFGPHGGAERYEVDLREALGEQLPRLDLILLGLGRDGHVASLFPNRRALSEREHAVVGEEDPGLEPHVPRITLTLPVLCHGRHVVFLVTGQNKAEAVERAFGGDAPTTDVPASLVRPVDGRLTLLLDPDAAARLER